MNKFTITEFANRFPNDDACLHHLWTLRYGTMTECPECKAKADYKKVKDRRSYQCSACAHQIYPTQGTIFEKTTTPLIYWFTAIYLFTTTRNGVAAKELERQFNVCYKTALRMAHQIKKLISNRTENVMTGIIEADELVLGMKAHNMHKKERSKYSNKNYGNKTIVFGMLERGGQIITEIISNNDSDNIKPIIRERVAPGSVLITDGAKAYIGINKGGIKHYSVNHQQNEWTKGRLHTNSLEGYWSMVKRTINGTHIHVSKKHLKKYLDECSFRYEMRHQQDIMFETILSRV